MYVVGAFSVGTQNRDGERISIQFCIKHKMSVVNTYKYQESHKWVWYRYNSVEQAYTEKSMIDLALTNNKRLFKDVKGIPS